MIRKISLSTLALWIILVSMLTVMGAYHHWTEIKPFKRGVIQSDVISYYSYLPATFIYGDVGMDFLDKKGFKNDGKFWPVRLENGNKVIQTSMGLSILYSPFFFMAHWLSPILDKPQDGFTSTYQLFLVLSSLFWVMMGLLVLRRILLRYFNSITTAITLVLVALGTNLFYYTVHEGPMSHSYNFALITFFLCLVIRWYEKPNWRRSLLLGLVYGMIVLIRPTNILVGILFLAWGITSLEVLKKRPVHLMKNYRHILLMLLMFLLVWLPQMLYWKSMTGNFLFNSYASRGSNFYFASPQVLDLLFSFRKGWFIYTPLMLVATIGLFFLARKYRGFFWPVSLYLAAMIYVLASWWSWWSGGSFGLRSFVDLYGVMALPLAAVIEASLKRRRLIAWATGTVLLFIVFMNQFQTLQYREGLIHYVGMTRDAYKNNFLRMHPNARYWEMLSIPDYYLARQGIFYFYLTSDKNEDLKALKREEGMGRIRDAILSDSKLMKEIRNHARRSGIALDEATETVVERVYLQKTGL